MPDDRWAEEVHRCFTARLVALARQHLDGELRQKLDPEDVVQSVYRSFFGRCADGRLEVDGLNLWPLLALMTVRKCANYFQHFRAARRDINREATGALAEEPDTAGPPAPGPPPEAAVVLADLIEELLRGLEGAERQIVLLALQGQEIAELAAQAGRSERTVRRVLERAQRRLRRLQDV